MANNSQDDLESVIASSSYTDKLLIAQYINAIVATLGENEEFATRLNHDTDEVPSSILGNIDIGAPRKIASIIDCKR